MFRIIQSLLGLIKIDILGVSACGHNHNISLFWNPNLVEPVQKTAAFPVRFDKMTRYAAADSLLFVQHYIYNKINRYKPFADLIDILTNGIACNGAGLGFFPDHPRMIALDGVAGGYAGHNCLGSSAVAGKIVKFNIAQADADIGIRYGLKDIYGSTPARGAHVGEFTFGINTGYPAVDGLSHKFFLFLLRGNSVSCISNIAIEQNFEF